jgi:hypothetical protein
VGFVNDDGIPTSWKALDLAEDKWELLQGSDDNPCLLTFQGFSKLLLVTVDLHDHASRVLELIDRVL